MKKIIITIAASFFTLSSYCQDGTAEVSNFGVSYLLSEPSQLGVSYEFTYSKKESKRLKTGYVSLALASMDYKVDGFTSTGNGFVIEFKDRLYFNEEAFGFFSQSGLAYGSLKFSETSFLGDVDGTYSYFSLFNPDFGYRFNAGKFTIDPTIGVQWVIQVKGKGFIDNNNVDVWNFRAGLRLGYSF